MLILFMFSRMLSSMEVTHHPKYRIIAKSIYLISAIVVSRKCFLILASKVKAKA